MTMKGKTVTTPEGPYSDKPSVVSEPNDWHEISFQISVDTEVDWDKLDLRQWAHTVARFTALRMAETTLDDTDDEEMEKKLVKTLLMGIRVERIKFVDDEGLHDLIDSFEEGDGEQ